MTLRGTRNLAGFTIMIAVMSNGLPTTRLSIPVTSTVTTLYPTSAILETSTHQSTTSESSPTFGLTIHIPRVPARPVQLTTTTTSEPPDDGLNKRWKGFKIRKSTVGVVMGGGSFMLVAGSFIFLQKEKEKKKKTKKRKSLHKMVLRVPQSSVSTQTDRYIEQDESTRPDTPSLELIVNTNTSDHNPIDPSASMSGSQLSESLPPSPTPHPSVPSNNTASTPSQTSMTSSDDSPRLRPSSPTSGPTASYSTNKVPKRKPSGRQRNTIPTPELSPRRPLSAWGPPEPRECWQGPSGSYTTDNRQTKDYYYPVKNPWEWNRTP